MAKMADARRDIFWKTDRMNDRRREIESEFRCDDAYAIDFSGGKAPDKENLPNALSGFFHDER